MAAPPRASRPMGGRDHRTWCGVGARCVRNERQRRRRTTAVLSLVRACNSCARVLTTASLSYDSESVVPGRQRPARGSTSGNGERAGQETRPARSRPEAERQPEYRPGSQRTVASYPSRPPSGDVLRTPNTSNYARKYASCQSSLWGTNTPFPVPLEQHVSPARGETDREVHPATRIPSGIPGVHPSSVVSAANGPRHPDRGAVGRGAHERRSPTRHAVTPRSAHGQRPPLRRPGAAGRR